MAGKHVERKEKLMERITQAGAVRPEDKQDIENILCMDCFQRALHEILVESDAQGASILAANLEDPVQRAAATKAQGIAQGLLRAVESLLDQIPEDNIEEDN